MRISYPPGSGSSGAPSNAQYVTLATDATLTVERVLTGTANQITITDNGAGGTVVLSLPQSIDVTSDVTFASLTLEDAYIQSNLANFNIFGLDASSTITFLTDKVVVAPTGLIVGAGAVARSTTEPTNALSIFDGTAPAGTLANGVQFYSVAGVPYVMNAAGTAVNLMSGGGGGTPGGSTTQVQYNNAGAFGGITGATTDGTALTLVAPVLGTPASVTLTNATGLPLSTGVTGNLPVTNLNSGTSASGSTFWRGDGTWATPAGAGDALTTNPLSQFAATTSAQLAGVISDETGSGALVFGTSPTLVTPALGTPSSGVLTNATGLPIASGVSGLGTGVATALAVNVGSAGAPVVLDGALGTPASGTLTNATGLPIGSGVSGLGTGIATALAVNTGSAGAPVLLNGALGTPSSGTLTSATGLPLTTGVTGNLPVTNLNSGTGASGSTFWCGDGTWSTPASGGAPTTSQYVTLATDGTLSNERVLTGTTNQVVITDNGAGSTVVLSTPQDLHTSATWQAATLGLGAAIQRGGLFEIKNSSAASLTAGTGSAIISNGSNFNGLSVIHTSFSTDADDGYKIRQVSSGTTSITLGGGSLLSATAGLTHQMDYANATYGWYWGTPGSEASVNFYQGTLQTRIDISGRIIPTGAPQGNNFYNALTKTSVVDSSGNSASVGEWGSEGNWTNAGGFTERRHYLWDHDATIATDLGRTLYYWQKSTEDVFTIGGDGRRLDLGTQGGRIISSGLTIATSGADTTIDTSVSGALAADGTVLSGQFGTTLTKNDTNTRTFPILQIKPTFNTGGSNTTTTVNVLDIDTTNTAVTGLTTNLLKASYGGILRAQQSSTGYLTLSANAATVAPLGDNLEIHSLDATQLGVGMYAYGTNASFKQYRSSGTAASKTALASGNQIGNNIFGGWDTTGWFSGAAVRSYALETWSGSGHGAYLRFDTVAVGSTSLTARAWVSNHGLTLGSGLPTRSTTQPTFALTLEDGTAPAGTLTNAVSLYSSSGELLAMDAAGNVSNLTLPFTSSVQGVVPASGGTSTHKFLTQNATFASPVYTKAITIESPGASEDVSLWFADDAITVTKIVAVCVGSTPSVTWTVRHGTDRSAAGAEVVTGGTTTTSTTTGDVVTSFNDATVVADSFVWLETTAQSGTVTSINVTVHYTID